jgi:hypothetical protein
MKPKLTAALAVLLATASMEGVSQTDTESAAESRKLAELDADHLSPATRKRLTKGYTAVKKDDVQFYCKREMLLGSRLPTRQCFTIDQLVDRERVRVLTQQKVERKQAQNPTVGN